MILPTQRLHPGGNFLCRLYRLRRHKPPLTHGKQHLPVCSHLKQRPKIIRVHQHTKRMEGSMLHHPTHDFPMVAVRHKQNLIVRLRKVKAVTDNSVIPYQYIT